MKIDRQYLPVVDIAYKSKDIEDRPNLQHLMLERIEGDKGRLIAADGFMLAVVPVTLHEDDVPGPIHPEALKAAAKDCPKREYEVTVYALDDIVRSVGHACFPRTRGWTERTRYPDIARIVPRDAHIKATDRTGAQCALNPEYLLKVHKALGGLGTVLWPTGPNSPIVVTPIISGGDGGYSRFEADGLPKLPYAVVMPMHVASGIGLPKERDHAA